MSAPVHPLRKIAIFSTLADDTLTRLAQYVIRREYLRGELIQLESDPSRSAYFIAAGQVQIFHLSPAGREQIMLNLGAGESFNTVPLFSDDSHNRASARALTAVSLYLLRKEDFTLLINTCPDLAQAMLKDFATKLTRLTGLVEQLSLHSIRGRLARFLIEQADRGEQASRGEQANRGEQTGRWTQDEIAAHLGSVRDVIGRTLRSFEDAGLIRRTRSRIQLLNRSALETEAEE